MCAGAGTTFVTSEDHLKRTVEAGLGGNPVEMTALHTTQGNGAGSIWCIPCLTSSAIAPTPANVDGGGSAGVEFCPCGDCGDCCQKCFEVFEECCVTYVLVSFAVTVEIVARNASRRTENAASGIAFVVRAKRII